MSQPQPPKRVFIVNSPWGPTPLDASLPGIRRQLMCAREGCNNVAVKVYHGEGRFSDKQYCNKHYDEELGKAVLEEARKRRREALTTGLDSTTSKVKPDPRC